MILKILLPYIAIFYALDCLILVKQGRMLFKTLIGNRFNMKSEGVQLSGLLPSGRSFLSDKSHFIFTEKWLRISNNKNHSSEKLLYDDIQSIKQNDDAILINGKQFYEAASFSHAQSLITLIEKLKNSGKEKKEQVIFQGLKQSLDAAGVRRIKAESEIPLLWLEMFCWVLILLVFGLFPAFLYLAEHVRIAFTPLWACLGLCYAIILVMSHRLLKKFYPSDKTFRSSVMAAMILCPPAAMHAAHSVGKRLFAEFEYLAVAAEFLHREDFKTIMRKEFMNIDKKAKIRSELTGYYSMRRSLLLDLLDQAGLTMSELMAPPPQSDPNSHCYCPKCHGQYRSGFHSCADCGISLKKFSKK